MALQAGGDADLLAQFSKYEVASSEGKLLSHLQVRYKRDPLTRRTRSRRPRAVRSNK